MRMTYCGAGWTTSGIVAQAAAEGEAKAEGEGEKAEAKKD